MQIGYIGLGKMGSNMVSRLKEYEHAPVVFDTDAAARKKARSKGVKTAENIEELISALKPPRLVWIMVPHQYVGDVVKQLKKNVEKGDVVIDGGNSPFEKSIKRAKAFSKKGVHFLDVGVSGGPDGARNGACMMIGGGKKQFKKCEQLFKDLCVDEGYARVGPSGAGHYVKMIHNGIEYGMMQAMAEGFSIMKKSRRYDLDLKQIANVYAHGSVIESRLMDWMRDAFKKFGNDLENVTGRARESGEGKWTTELAHQLGIEDTVIHDALRARTKSQKKPSFQGRIIMALRNQFGGHAVKRKKK